MAHCPVISVTPESPRKTAFELAIFFPWEMNKAPSNPQIWTAVFLVSKWSMCKPHGLWTKWVDLLRGQQPCGFCSYKSESPKTFFRQAENQLRLCGLWSLCWLTAVGSWSPLCHPHSHSASKLWLWVVKRYYWAEVQVSLTKQMFKEILYSVSEEENIETFLSSECAFSVAA